MPQVFYDSAEFEVYIHDGNKNNLRTIEAQIVQKRKNNDPRPKFTSSYKIKKRVCRLSLCNNILKWIANFDPFDLQSMLL